MNHCEKGSILGESRAASPNVGKGQRLLPRKLFFYTQGCSVQARCDSNGGPRKLLNIKKKKSHLLLGLSYCMQNPSHFICAFFSLHSKIGPELAGSLSALHGIPLYT